MASVLTDSENIKVVDKTSSSSYASSLAILTMLFFIWGFIVSMNDVLIPKLKSVFTLLHWQAMLVQTAFFGAYFIVSFAYFILSVKKEDIIMRIGYKNGIIVGLLICALGAILFYPAAEFKSYGFFLGALFILASGTTILQIAANPYVTILGSPETSSARLILTQAFNSFGTTIAPMLGGYLIFDTIESQTLETSANSVKLPYVFLTIALVVIAILIKMAKLPTITKTGEHINHAGALKHRHLVLGVICIFAYVGGEVTIGSNLMSYCKLPEIGGIAESIAKNYLTFFWAGAMIGRFLGAIALSNFSKSSYKLGLMLLISAVVFVVLYSFYGLMFGLIMFGLVLFNALVFRLGSFKPHTTLTWFAGIVILLLLITIFLNGEIALWSMVAIGFFNSIMFPTIFDLSIKGLGNYTSQGSSLLIMACVGGAIVPLFQGYLADVTNNLQISYVIPVLCYAYVFYYGRIGYKVKKRN